MYLVFLQKFKFVTRAIDGFSIKLHNLEIKDICNEIKLMTDLETECLQKLSFSPLFYFRYVDDIITCIPHEKLDDILTIFNSFDDRLQFTHEIEVENRISLNYMSQHPKHQKIAMVYNYVDLAIKLSSEQYHESNIKKIKSLFVENSYPRSFIDKHVSIRLNKIKYQNNTYNKENGCNN